MKSTRRYLISTITCACMTVSLTSVQAQSFTPAVIFDMGGKHDKSFNQSAFDGAERFKKDFNVAYLEAEVTADSQREQIFRNLIRRGATVIFATGFAQRTIVGKLAPEFPDVKFVLVNVKPEADYPNVQSAMFREEEGSFLAGIAAASSSKTAKVGFVGGMDQPLIRRFGCGYAQGVKYFNSKAEVITNMVGTTPAAFRDPTRGGELAISQFDRGVDVIFAAAGNTGTGVLQAAKDKGRFAIGVDSNQNHLHPGTMLTSMVKHVDTALYEAYKMVRQQQWKSGVVTYGLSNKGISLAMDEHNQKFISKELAARLKKAEEDIVSGKIKVHDYVTNNACPV